MSLASLFDRSRQRFYVVTVERVKARANHDERHTNACCLCGEVEADIPFPTPYECLPCFRETLLLLKQVGDRDAVRTVTAVIDNLGAHGLDYSELLAPIFCPSCGETMRVENGLLTCRASDLQLPRKTTEWLLKILTRKSVITPSQIGNRDHCPNCRARMDLIKTPHHSYLKCDRCALEVKYEHHDHFQRFHNAHMQRVRMMETMEKYWASYSIYNIGAVVLGRNETADRKTMVCIQNGMSGDHEPIWPAAGVVIDGSCRWMVRANA